MRTVALCAARYAGSVRKAAGVEPITFPPAAYDTFNPAILGLDPINFLYLKFHGGQNIPFLFYGDYQMALGKRHIDQMPIAGAVVFAAVCWLPQSPLIDLFLDAGAQAVIAGDGKNYGSPAGEHTPLLGADLLGYIVRQALRLGMTPRAALEAGKLALRFAPARSATQRMARDDALAFEIYERCNDASALPN